MFFEREDLHTSDPLMHTLDYMRNNSPEIYRPIEEVMLRDDYLKNDRDSLCQQLRQTPEDKTKIRLYLTMNPDLSVHPLYTVTSTNSIVEDNLRMAFSRVCLCSHRLRSETGRWYHVPSDQRFCPHCDGATIQNEEHIFQCPATLPIREEYGVHSDLQSILHEPSKAELVCLKRCLKLLESINKPDD